MLLPKELLKQRITASSPVKINAVLFKEWMTASFSETEADALLQGMDGCNSSGEINRLPLKNRMPEKSLSEK